MDRDANFSSAFRNILADADVNPVRLPAKSPNLNAHLERFHFFGEKSLRLAIGSFLLHYHAERNHQGLGNQLIEQAKTVEDSDGEVLCRQRLGGILNFYHRKAA